MDKEAQKYKKYLSTLTEGVVRYLSLLDSTMKEKESYERDKKIAKLSNALDMANDRAMHFGLGYGFKKIGNIKNKYKKD